MRFVQERREQTITIAGRVYRQDELNLLAQDLGTDPFYQDLVDFLREWFDDSDEVTVQTSGSTGTPKKMRVAKERMMNSARMTLTFLGLNNGDSTLLCMPMRYIAGKMVVVRALLGQLNLIVVPPCGNPLARLQEFNPGRGNGGGDNAHQEHGVQVLDFAAMVPLQVYNSLQEPRERALLFRIRHLIIGGGAVDARMTEQLQDSPNCVWSTYGMTETLSHIALRRINGVEASEFYQPFATVRLQQSEEGTLIIEAPQVCPELLHTNDIVEFNEQGGFRIRGRRDNVVNSGGIKLQIEEIEDKIRQQHPDWHFMLSSQPHDKFGSVLVMLYDHSLQEQAAQQEQVANQEMEPSAIKAGLEFLSPYERPKLCLEVQALPVTGTDKPDRARARELAATATVWL